MDNLEKAFELFDEYNKQDPNKIEWEGTTYPAQYFYSLQTYNWVKKLDPDAREVLLLAARAAHIGRWKSPRESYPMGKPGYYKWRTELAKFHAETAGDLMAKAGYEEDEIKKVQSIILKEQLRTDYEVQILEDALCLVFLQFQYDDFIKDHDDEKVVRILKKSWGKMNQRGREAAGTLQFNGRSKELLQIALA